MSRRESMFSKIPGMSYVQDLNFFNPDAKKSEKPENTYNVDKVKSKPKNFENNIILESSNHEDITNSFVPQTITKVISKSLQTDSLLYKSLEKRLISKANFFEKRVEKCVAIFQNWLKENQDNESRVINYLANININAKIDNFDNLKKAIIDKYQVQDSQKPKIDGAEVFLKELHNAILKTPVWNGNPLETYKSEKITFEKLAEAYVKFRVSSVEKGLGCDAKKYMLELSTKVTEQLNKLYSALKKANIENKLEDIINAFKLLTDKNYKELSEAIFKDLSEKNSFSEKISSTFGSKLASSIHDYISELAHLIVESEKMLKPDYVAVRIARHQHEILKHNNDEKLKEVNFYTLTQDIKESLPHLVFDIEQEYATILTGEYQMPIDEESVG